MPNYPACLPDSKDHLRKVEAISCPGDERVSEAANRFVGGQDVEVRHRQRKIVRISRNPR